MDIIFDKTTSEILTELEKTQKDFWNIPRKTAVLINTFIKMMNIKELQKTLITFQITNCILSAKLRKNKLLSK